ncbi:MAG: hypothetical protein FWC17_03945 [Treponema sp.]|nr:hypothetical protein [Treponema sp.]
MCPDKQILSIYLDEELPSPWKEKLEAHMADCPVCAEKYEKLRQLRRILKKDMTSGGISALSDSGTCTEQEINDAKNRVWQRLASGGNRQRIRPNSRLWQRRLSIPLPAAAAAAVIIVLVAVITLQGTRISNNAMMAQTDSGAGFSGFSAAADYEIPEFLQVADINDILKTLSSDGSDVIILTLPESQNFYRTGEPGIIRAADYNKTDGTRR